MNIMCEAVENKGPGYEELEGPLDINSSIKSIIMEVDSDPDPHPEVSANVESMNELENQYISTCEALGEKSEVTDSLIENDLLKLWTDFREGYEYKTFVNVDRCLESLLVCTAKLIFHVKYSKKVTAVPKRKLKETVNSCGEIIVDCPHRKTICLGIASFIDNPWAADKFTVVASSGVKSVLNISADASENLWNAEGWTMLETRVDFLVRLGEKCIDRVCSVLHVLASKGHQIYNIKQEDNQSKICYDPYKFSYSRYLEYLQVYSIMMFKKCISTQPLCSWDKQVLLNVIDGLIEKAKNPDAKPLFPKFKFWGDVNSAVEFLAKNATWLALKSTDGEKLEELFGKWLQLCAEPLKHSPLDDILDDFDKITSTNCMYRIANAAITYCGVVEWIRPKFVEIYVRALTKDMNTIEALKMHQPPDKEKIRELDRCLSLRYLELAKFFRDYPHTVKACLLTSFSLYPREDLLVCMFPQSVNGLYLQPELLPDEIRNLQTILSDIGNHPAEADLQLPGALCDDLENVIVNPRYSGLFRWNSEEELLKHCVQLLGDKSVDVIENKTLDFVNVDYEKYKDLPSQYDPEDDGIEKGFRSGERALRRRCKAIANRKLKAPKLTLKKSAVQRVLKSSKKGREKRMGLNVRKGRPPKVKLGIEGERKTKPARPRPTKPARPRPTKPARPRPEYKIQKRLPGKQELPNAEFFRLPWIANHFGKEMGLSFTEVFVQHVLPSTHELKEKSSRQYLKEKKLLDLTRIAIHRPKILNQLLVGDNQFRPEPGDQPTSNKILCDPDFAHQGAVQVKSEGLEVHPPCSSSSHDIQPPPGYLPGSNQGKYEMQHLLQNVGNHWPAFAYLEHFPPSHAELQDMLLGNGLQLQNLLKSGMKKKGLDGSDRLHIPKGKNCNKGMETNKAKIAPEKKLRKNLKKVGNKGSNQASEPVTMDKPGPNCEFEVKLFPESVTSIDERETNLMDEMRIPIHDGVVNDQSISGSLQLTNASSVDSPPPTSKSTPPPPDCAFQIMGTYKKNDEPTIVKTKFNPLPSQITRERDLGGSAKASPASDQLKKCKNTSTGSKQPGKTESESQAGSNRVPLPLINPSPQSKEPIGQIVARSMPKTYQNQNLRKKRLLVIRPSWNTPSDVDTIGGTTQPSSYTPSAHTEKSYTVINHPAEVAVCKTSSVCDSTKNETSHIPESTAIPPNLTEPPSYRTFPVSTHHSEPSYPLENSRKSIPIPSGMVENNFQATNEQASSKPDGYGNPLDNIQTEENLQPQLKIEVTGSLEPSEIQRPPSVMVEALNQRQSTDSSIVPVGDNLLTNQEDCVDKGRTALRVLPEGGTRDFGISSTHTPCMPKEKDNTSDPIVPCQNEYEHTILEQPDTVEVVSIVAKTGDSVAENAKIKPYLGKESGVLEIGTNNISISYASSDLHEQSNPQTVATMGYASCTQDGTSSKTVSAPDSRSTEQIPSSKSQATREVIRSKDGILATNTCKVSLNLRNKDELAKFFSVIAKKEVKIDQLKAIDNGANPLSKTISSNNDRDCFDADTNSNTIGNPDYARSASSKLTATSANDASQTLQEENTTVSLAVKQIDAHKDIESAPDSVVSTIEVPVSEANKYNSLTNFTTGGTKTDEENSSKNKRDSDHDSDMILMPSPEENKVDPHVEVCSSTTAESSGANDKLIRKSTLFEKAYNKDHSAPLPTELGDLEEETNEQHLLPTPPPLSPTDPSPGGCTKETLVSCDEILRNSTSVGTEDADTIHEVVDGLHEILSPTPETSNQEKDLSNDESGTVIVENSSDTGCEQTDQFIEDVCESNPVNDNEADDLSDQGAIVICNEISIEEPGLRCKNQLAPAILDNENVMEEAPASEIQPIIHPTVTLNDILEEACSDKGAYSHTVTEENVASTSCDLESTSSNSLDHNNVRTSNTRDTEAKVITVSAVDPLSEGSAVTHKNITRSKRIVCVRSHTPSDDTVFDISASTDSENSSDEEQELNGLSEGKFNDDEIEEIVRVDSKNENKTPRPLTPVEKLEDFINTNLKRKAKRPYEDEKIKVAPSVVKHVEKFGGGLRNLIACYVEVTPLADEAIPLNVRSQLNPVKRSSRIKGKKKKTVEAIKNVFKTEEKEDSSSSRSSSPEIEIVKVICNKTKTNKLQVRNLNSRESTSNETTRIKNENITGTTKISSVDNSGIGFRPKQDTSNFVQGSGVNGEFKHFVGGNVKRRRSNVDSPFDSPNKFARSTSNHRSPRSGRGYPNASGSRSSGDSEGDPDFRLSDDCNSCSADDSDSVKECAKSDLGNGQEILAFEPVPEEMTVDGNDPLAIENEGNDKKTELIILDDSGSSSASIENEEYSSMAKGDGIRNEVERMREEASAENVERYYPTITGDLQDCDEDRISFRDHYESICDETDQKHDFILPDAGLEDEHCEIADTCQYENSSNIDDPPKTTFSNPLVPTHFASHPENIDQSQERYSATNEWVSSESVPASDNFAETDAALDNVRQHFSASLEESNSEDIPCNLYVEMTSPRADLEGHLQPVSSPNDESSNILSHTPSNPSVTEIGNHENIVSPPCPQVSQSSSHVVEEIDETRPCDESHTIIENNRGTGDDPMEMNNQVEKNPTEIGTVGQDIKEIVAENERDDDDVILASTSITSEELFDASSPVIATSNNLNENDSNESETLEKIHHDSTPLEQEVYDPHISDSGIGCIEVCKNAMIGKSPLFEMEEDLNIIDKFENVRDAEMESLELLEQQNISAADESSTCDEPEYNAENNEATVVNQETINVEAQTDLLETNEITNTCTVCDEEIPEDVINSSSCSEALPSIAVSEDTLELPTEGVLPDSIRDSNGSHESNFGFTENQITAETAIDVDDDDTEHDNLDANTIESDSEIQMDCTSLNPTSGQLTEDNSSIIEKGLVGELDDVTGDEDTGHSPQILEHVANTASEPTEESQEGLSPALSDNNLAVYPPYTFTSPKKQSPPPQISDSTEQNDLPNLTPSVISASPEIPKLTLENQEFERSWLSDDEPPTLEREDGS